MSRTSRRLTGGLAVAVVMTLPRLAVAGSGSTGGAPVAPAPAAPPADVAVAQHGATMEVLLGIPGSSSSSENVASGSDSPQPKCTWETDLAQVISEVGDVDQYWQYRVAGARPPQRAAAPGPGIETFMRRVCGAGVNIGMWVMSPEAVDMQMLIVSAYAQAQTRLPLPSPNMSPAPEVGSVVNLGLWLAVHDPGQVNALAEIGPVWASVTARFTGMTWDMGEGTIVECAGLGTPYPVGSNLIEQGPCGHTYTAQPPIEGYTVTATSHWEVRLTTSDGRGERLDPMQTTSTFAYDVDEIITVGQAP